MERKRFVLICCNGLMGRFSRRKANTIDEIKEKAKDITVWSIFDLEQGKFIYECSAAKLAKEIALKKV